jgi:signal peptidase I
MAIPREASAVGSPIVEVPGWAKVTAKGNQPGTWSLNLNTPLPTAAVASAHHWEGGTLPSPKLRPAPSLPPTRDYLLEAGHTQVIRAAAVNPKLFWLKQTCLLVWVAALSLLGYYLISHYVVTMVEVQGRSMAPTLRDGDRYFLNRLAYHFRPPVRGEMVVVRDPGHEDCAVKRIVGLPGETVTIQGGIVSVNGRQLDESYLSRGTKTVIEGVNKQKVFLAKDSYFLLGDNRDRSEDSRHYGPIKRDHIIGVIAY